ncbi:MAG: phosphate ABC transporter, permease protein PstA, partial [Gammaproteobacteria bacterium]|nr:phosphate ABC transporter, permease protein PstA [Gammaproteobacteria bacterium]
MRNAEQKPAFKAWWKGGSPWVWLNAGAVSISMIMVLGLLLLIAVRGLSHFWPSTVHEMRVVEPDGTVSLVVGSIRDTESVTAARIRESGMTLETDKDFVDRYLVKTGNRDALGSDFRYLLAPRITDY